MSKLLLILVIIMGVCLIVGGAFVLTLSDFAYETTRHDVEQKESTTAEGITTIDLDVVSSDVHFIATDSNTIEVVFQGWASGEDNSPTMKAERNGETYEIKVEWKEKLFYWYRGELRIDVYIPLEYEKQIKVNSVSSDIYLETFELESFSSNTVSGDVHVSDAVVGKTAITTTSGDMKLEGELRSMTISSVSGDAKITTSIDNLVFESVSGDVSLTLPENASFAIEFDSVSGDLENEFPTIVESQKRNDVKGTVGDGKGSISINTVSGDASIDKT